MTVGLSGRVSKIRGAALVAAGTVVATFQLCGSLGLRINTSPSLPMGLYITTADAGANMVEFCPVEPFATFAIVRGYRDPGACRDGAAPLLKPIVAKPGDVVELSARGISVNGALLSNTAPLSKDTKGRPLEAWPFGRYIVASETVWVASSYHPRSFDSRYFGPISTSAIRNRMKAFLTP
jgi:conjugative transfer signal peptidase TraF